MASPVIVMYGLHECDDPRLRASLALFDRRKLTRTYSTVLAVDSTQRSRCRPRSCCTPGRRGRPSTPPRAGEGADEKGGVEGEGGRFRRTPYVLSPHVIHHNYKPIWASSMLRCLDVFKRFAKSTTRIRLTATERSAVAKPTLMARKPTMAGPTRKPK